MPKQLHLSAVIDLPDNIFEASEAIQSVRVPWHAALQTLTEKQVQFRHTEEVMETKAALKRSPRKAKQKPHNGEVVELPKDMPADLLA